MTQPYGQQPGGNPGGGFQQPGGTPGGGFQQPGGNNPGSGGFQQPGGNNPGSGGFQQPGGYPQAPPAPAYQQGYGGMPQAPQEYGGGPVARPGVVTAAAVLAYVQAGITTITTILVWLGISQQLEGQMIFQLVLALGQTLGIVLLIWGGIQAMGGKGRTILLAGAALEIVLSLLWIVRFAALDTGGIDFAENLKGGIIVIAILFAVMPVISLVLVMGQQATQYTQSRQG
jgi:hypothetical protein